MARALGMRDQLFHLRWRSLSLNFEVERHVLECAGRPTQVVLVGDAERGADVDIGFLDRDIV